jgi:phage baseplate assembly protein gpV
MTVRTRLDVGSLAKAVSRPGIDPRRWIELGQVTERGVDENGVFVDVRLLPSMDLVTCYVTSRDATPDGGSLCAPAVGAIVVVAFPGGDENGGGFVLGQVWNGSAAPPAEFRGALPLEPTDDPVTVVRAGATLRLVAREGASIRLEVSGPGKVELVSTGESTVEVRSETAVIVDSPDVRLGDTPGSQVARVGDLVVGSTPPMVSPAGPIAAVGVPPTSNGGITIVGQITTGARSVKA